MLDAVIQQFFSAQNVILTDKIKKSTVGFANETYGELYYYSVVKLLKHVCVSDNDHFLDIGSGLGKLVFQIFLTTKAYCVTGIEINSKRHNIAEGLKDSVIKLHQQFNQSSHLGKQLQLIEGDFLYIHFSNVTIAYVCSTVFSYELIEAIGKKLNTIETIHTIISLRKLPDLLSFTLTKKLFLQGSWDNTVCYIYKRIL